MLSQSVLFLLSAVYLVSAAPTRVACIGDSITAGACSKTTNGYPAVLQTVLGNGYLVQNFGNSGRTMLKLGLCGPPPGGDCSYWDTDTWKSAQAFSPDIVTIMLGTNDAKNFNWFGQQEPNKPDSFEQDFLDMIKIVSALPSKPKVFVMVPPPLYQPVYDMNATIINQVFPQLMRKIASEAKLTTPVIDIFAVLGGNGMTDPQDFCDGCHPVDAGYIKIANAMAPILRSAK